MQKFIITLEKMAQIDRALQPLRTLGAQIPSNTAQYIADVLKSCEEVKEVGDTKDSPMVFDQLEHDPPVRKSEKTEDTTE